MKLYVEKQFIKFAGATVRIYGENRILLARADAKAFKLREKIHFYSDENRTDEIFRIEARNIVDFGATYDIHDKNNNLVASLRRSGLHSTFIRDH